MANQHMAIKRFTAEASEAVSMFDKCEVAYQILTLSLKL